MKFVKKVILVLILGLTGFLSFYSVCGEGYANEYYSAAVKSMLASWHNFFFASFDPGGYVSVDKPALGLWLQALSAYLFGYAGWSLILPEALSAVVSGFILYILIRRYSGETAGMLSALIFGITPVIAAVSRTNNLDSSLVMVLLLAAWALSAAAEKGSFKLLLLSMALVGLGFNIKMLEAYMVLPAFYAAYLFSSPIKTGGRILHLAGATAVLLAVSLSWAVTVDLTPAADRPYVGSSRTNSVLELALGYNGIQRITGMSTGDGNRPEPGRDAVMNGIGAGGGGVPESGGGTVMPDRRTFAQDRGFIAEGNGTGGDSGGGGPGGENENGEKGVFRIFNRQLAGQISWLLPMAFFGAFVFFLKAVNCKRGANKKMLGFALFWTGWIVPMLVYFNVSGFFHRYYLSMLAPGIAALAGAGIAEMYRAYLSAGRKWVLLPASLMTTCLLQWLIISRYPEWKLLILFTGAVIFAAVTVLVVVRLLNTDYMRKTIRTAAAVGFGALLVSPLLWAATPLMYGSNTTLPYAGPELKNSRDGFGRTGINDKNRSSASELVQFLLKNKNGEKYLVAVRDARSAAPIIIGTGEHVMAVGGFSGSDKILTVNMLKQLVDSGELRYYLVSGGGPPGGPPGGAPGGPGKVMGPGGQASGLESWVIQNGKPVTYGGAEESGQLYDLALEKNVS